MKRQPQESLLCPLCRSESGKILEIIKIRDLKKLYEKFLGNELSHIFKSHQSLLQVECEKCGLIYFFPEIIGDEKFYQLISEKDFYYPKEKAEFDHAYSFLAPDDMVLEIGCGSGNFGKKIMNYQGLDINTAGLKTAMDIGVNVKRQTIESHAVDNKGKYDTVCIFQTLEHVGNLRNFLTEALKCLKRGGKLIISVPSANSFLRYNTNHLLNLPPHHVTWWTDQALNSIAELYNLQLLSLWHEKVQDIHLKSYIRIFYIQLFQRLLGVRQRSVRLRGNLRENFAAFMAFLLAKKTNGMFTGQEFRPNGHTVLAVYEKGHV